MRNRQFEGIVLKRINYQEADRIITFFAKELGKIKLVGKGIRKINSRRASHLEIFSHVKVLAYEKSHLFYIVEANLLNSFTYLRKNLRKVAIAYHLCEIVDRILPEREKNRQIFVLILNTFTQLEKENSSEKIRSLVRFFVHSLLSELGYVSREKIIPYSQLLKEIENISEKNLFSFNLLTKLKSVL